MSGDERRRVRRVGVGAVGRSLRAILREFDAEVAGMGAERSEAVADELLVRSLLWGADRSNETLTLESLAAIDQC